MQIEPLTLNLNDEQKNGRLDKDYLSQICSINYGLIAFTNIINKRYLIKNYKKCIIMKETNEMDIELSLKRIYLLK